MSRPPLPPLPPIPPRPGLFRQTPPAAFTPVFGLLGLGLAWRRAAEAFALPAGWPETLLGAATLLYLFVLAAYLAKAVRRPCVVAEDLRVLPGRAGLTAASLSVLLLAAVAGPYSAAPARAPLLPGGGLPSAPAPAHPNGGARPRSGTSPSSASSWRRCQRCRLG
mgnify:CR=1 FL=1